MPFYFAIQNPVYAPALRDVNAVTNAPQALVTTTFAHGYITGTIVRMVIPQYFGMEALNKKQSSITVTSDTTFTLDDLDTTFLDPFSVPPEQPGFNYTPAQVVPIGTIPSIIIGTSFVNQLRPQ